MAATGGYTVKAVSKALGISPHTVRAWESRYGAVSPSRTQTNRRLYTSRDLARLQAILQLVNSGHSIGSIASLSEKKLADLLPKKGEENIIREAVTSLIGKLSRYDLGGIAEQLESLRLRNSTRDYVINVLSPLLGQVGMLVSKGRLSIAQEHALSAIIRDQIGQTMQILRRDSRPKDSRPTLLFATPEGDLHEFGILLAAALCASYGLRAFYLGANLPAEALALAARALRPDIVVLGNSPTAIPNSPPFETFLRFLAKTLHPSVEIWIGGRGKAPHLRAILGKRRYQALDSLAAFDAKVGRFV